MDAKATFIYPDDPAWDADRIERESAENEEEHPLAAYWRGDTRYDLHARTPYAGEEVSAGDYITGEPDRYHLRRLSVDQIAEVGDLLAREWTREGEHASLQTVWVKCARFGLSGIDSRAVQYEARGGRVTEGCMRSLFDHGSMPLIVAIGQAAWNLSKPITEAEGKR